VAKTGQKGVEEKKNAKKKKNPKRGAGLTSEQGKAVTHSGREKGNRLSGLEEPEKK